LDEKTILIVAAHRGGDRLLELQCGADGAERGVLGSRVPLAMLVVDEIGYELERLSKLFDSR
jgi:hypothetical protein